MRLLHQIEQFSRLGREVFRLLLLRREALYREILLVVGLPWEETRVDSPYLLGLVYITNGEDGELVSFERSVERAVGPAARLVRGAGGDVQSRTTWTNNAFHVRFMEMPTENAVDVRVESRPDVRAFWLNRGCSIGDRPRSLRRISCQDSNERGRMIFRRVLDAEHG